METIIRRYSLPLMLLITVATGFTLIALLHRVLSWAVASTIGMGAGVSIAVYIDRRWLTPSHSAVRESLEIGGATGFGWAVAQAILYFW